MNYFDFFSQHVPHLKPDSAGGQAAGLCPFHEDRNASFSLNLLSGVWSCFAGCGSGNAPQFAERLGIDPPVTNRDIPIISAMTTLSDGDLQRGTAFHTYLLANFDVLTNGKTWTRDIITKTRTGYDYSTKRFTFLHCDLEGQPLNIRWHKSASGEKPYSLNGRGNCRLYPLQLLKDYKPDQPLLFVEGEKDTVTALSQGFQAVTSTTGAACFPKDLTPLAGFQKVCIVYDRDQAGRNGASKLAERLKTEFPKMIVKIHHWESDLPKGYDVTNFFEDGQTPEDFQRLIENAEVFQLPEKLVEDKIFSMSDSGIAELFASLFGDQVRFNFTSGKWLIWNGFYWKPDQTNHIVEFGILAARRWKKIAAAETDSTKSLRFFKFGLLSENKIKIGFFLEISKSLKPIPSIESDWDVDPCLLQFTNGTLDLKTFEFRAGRPTDMISQNVGYSYDASASCPTWTRAIDQIFESDADVIEFFQRACGYSLAGDVSEQCFFMLHGNGANGKTTVLNVLQKLLGDYAQTTSFSTFEMKGDSASNDVASLCGTRFVSASESGETRHLNEERLKSLTGGDNISARFLFKEFFTFSPIFKLWLSVNSLPRVQDFSYAFWRRVRLIPFNKRFVGTERDDHLFEKLLPEIPGILNWAVDGLRSWQVAGLRPPAKVRQATVDYRIESDEILEFLESQTIQNPSAVVACKPLFDAFLAWHSAEKSGKPPSQTAFGRRFSAVSGLKSVSSGAERRKCYTGIGLKTEKTPEEVPF